MGVVGGDEDDNNAVASAVSLALSLLHYMDGSESDEEAGMQSLQEELVRHLRHEEAGSSSSRRPQQQAAGATGQRRSHHHSHRRSHGSAEAGENHRPTTSGSRRADHSVTSASPRGGSPRVHLLLLLPAPRHICLPLPQSVSPMLTKVNSGLHPQALVSGSGAAPLPL